MFEFRWTVAGEEIIFRRFSRLSDTLHDFTPAFREMKLRFYEGEKRQFETEGGWGGEGWVPLVSWYAEYKRRHFPGTKILELTGALKRSLTVSGSEGNVEEIAPLYMVLGTSNPAAMEHHRGEGVPVRRPIQMPESEKKAWTSILHAHLWKNQ